MKPIINFIIPLFICLHLLSPHLNTFITDYGFYTTFLIVFSCFLSSFWLSFIDFLLFTFIHLVFFYFILTYSTVGFIVYCLICFISSVIGIFYFLKADTSDNKLSMFLHFFIISIILVLVDLQFFTMSVPFFKIASVILPLVLFYVWRFYTVLLCAYRHRKEMQQKK